MSFSGAAEKTYAAAKIAPTCAAVRSSGTWNRASVGPHDRAIAAHSNAATTTTTSGDASNATCSRRITRSSTALRLSATPSSLATASTVSRKLAAPAGYLNTVHLHLTLGRPPQQGYRG
jgi:hypothetical protein